jgi:precorrin-6B methylase 2
MGNQGYALQQNEVVILKSEEVYHEKINIDELLLTNLNIIAVSSKGVFKKQINVQYFPIDQIKIFNGKAWAIIPEEDECLEIYFLNGQETFEFGSKKEAIKWADNINSLLAGERMVVKCTKCEASITGIRDHVVCCQYCDSEQRL